MSGIANWQAQIRIDIEDLKKRIKVAEGEINNFTNEDRKVKLDIDTKTLESAIQKLDKMLDSLGKGTGDFKQFENLSKELSSIVSEVQSLSKAFGKVDDSGAKTLLSSIQNIDKSLSELSQNILNVNKNMSNMGGNTSGAVKQVENITNESKKAASALEDVAKAQEKVNGQKTNISSGMKDAFPNADTKLDETVTSAKDLDKTLEQVDIPTDSFDKVLKKLDRTKSELVDIVKITKQSVSDADGKFHDSYTLKDSRGSTEIYGMNSKTDKGQILRQNIVGYDVKKDTVDNSKELLAIEKQLQKEIEASDKANQKKWQDFQKEQANYEESVNKVNSAIQKTDEILDTLPLHDKLDSQFLDMIDSVDNLNSKLKSGELTLSEYKNEVKSVTSEYSKMVSIQQKRDIEEYNTNAKANLENAKNIQAEWDKNLKAIQDYMDAVTKLNNLKSKDKGTGSEANQIELQTENVEKLKQAAWDARKNLSSMQAENPDIIAWKQWVDMMELFDQASKGSAESVAKLKDVLDNIKALSLDKYENKLSSYLNKTDGYDTTIARLEDGGWSSPEYLKNVQKVKDAVKEYDDLLNKIKTEQSGIASDEDIQKLKEYEDEIKNTISTVTNMSAAEKGYNAVSGQKELDKIHKILNENTKMSAKAKDQIKAFYKEIESGNPSMSLDKIHTEIMKIYNAEVEAGRAGKSMWSAIKEKAWYGMASAIGTYFGFNDIIQYGKEAFNVIKDLDTALVDLKKTTSMSATQLENFYYDSNDVAKQMGVTTQEIIEQASAWSRLGYSSKEESTEMAKLSSQFASISPGMSTDESQEGLVSIMKAFDIDPDNVKSEIMDKVNTLGNNFAEDNQDVVEGLKRSAAAMSAMGQSFTDTAALFTGGMEILQDPESMGTALRTLSMRVRGYDEETNQLSDDLVNVTGEVANLTKTTQDSQGVSLFTDATQEHYRSMVEYLGDIADRWDLISEKNQTELLQKLFGKNRANAGAAIIQNFDQVRAAIEAMDESAGSADKEMDTIENSLDYKLNALKETWVGIIQDMSDRGTLGGIINGLTGISDAIGRLFNGLQQISSLDGNISSLGGTLGTVVGLVQSLTGHGEIVLRPSL